MIRALISYPRPMSAKAILSTIMIKMRMNAEEERYRDYAASCLRLLTENTAPAAAYYTDGVSGAYMTAEYTEIIGRAQKKPAPEPGKAAAGIRTKLREG